MIDAINNAVKHIRLDTLRYKKLEQHYGPISFHSFSEEDGRVVCVLEGYRFDYARVVLRPACKALSGWDFEAAEEILDFARGDFDTDNWSADDELMASVEPQDAINQMIVACNSERIHCEESEDHCVCAEFVFEGGPGRFESRFRSDFDFDGVMSRISGAHSPWG